MAARWSGHSHSAFFRKMSGARPIQASSNFFEARRVHTGNLSTRRKFLPVQSRTVLRGLVPDQRFPVNRMQARNVHCALIEALIHCFFFHNIKELKHGREDQKSRTTISSSIKGPL